VLNKEEVKHIAKLARLGLSESEIEKYQKELSSILDYIEKLKEADVSKAEPASYCLPDSSFRPETSGRQSGREDKSEKLLKLAPETENGYLKVKSIIKN
jgi:aspartyl-tRNA(Asn)/glutamyl-tRNA(Gln) amidotransferase subunit C